jgi:hypothetical protein
MPTEDDSDLDHQHAPDTASPVVLVHPDPPNPRRCAWVSGRTNQTHAHWRGFPAGSLKGCTTQLKQAVNSLLRPREFSTPLVFWGGRFSTSTKPTPVCVSFLTKGDPRDLACFRPCQELFGGWGLVTEGMWLEDRTSSEI